MNLASRNGLLNFIILGGLGGMLGLWNRNWGFKVTIVVAALFAVGAAAYLFKDSPTVQRFIDMTEEGGGDRLNYWAAGIDALHEDPIFGLGGDESASIFAVSKYAPGIDDHVMHNTFVEYAVEYGYVGFLFFMTVVCTILYHAYKNFMFAIKYNDMLLAGPSISYFISIFAGLFISRVWESTLWYNMILVFGIYILYRMPVEQAMKNRKISFVHGLPDPMEEPSLAYIPTNM
jgi:O-antigen ligase